MGDDFARHMERIIHEIQSYDPSTAKQIQQLLLDGVTSLKELQKLVLTSEIPSTMRALGCWLLGKIDDEKALDTVIRASTSRSSPIAVSALRSIGQFQSPKALAALKQGLKSKRAELRAASAFSLRLQAGKQVVALLTQVATDKKETDFVRGLAIESLSFQESDGSVLNTLIELLADSSFQVRYWAVYSLGELGDQNALSHLSNLLTDSDETHDAALSRHETLAAITKIKARKAQTQ